MTACFDSRWFWTCSTSLVVLEILRILSPPSKSTWRVLFCFLQFVIYLLRHSWCLFFVCMTSSCDRETWLWISCVHSIECLPLFIYSFSILSISGLSTGWRSSPEFQFMSSLSSSLGLSCRSISCHVRSHASPIVARCTWHDGMHGPPSKVDRTVAV